MSNTHGYSWPPIKGGPHVRNYDGEPKKLTKTHGPPIAGGTYGPTAHSTISSTGCDGAIAIAQIATVTDSTIVSTGCDDHDQYYGRAGYILSRVARGYSPPLLWQSSPY